MTEQLISFEIAKLAKEKGFKIPTKVMYKGNEKSYGHNNEWGIDEKRLDGEFPYTNQQWYSIPTQSVLQKWLREKHKIHIYLFPLDNNKWGFENNSISINLDYIFINYMYKGKEYNSYEEALEVGLQEALNFINSDLFIDNEG